MEKPWNLGVWFAWKVCEALLLPMRLFVVLGCLDSAEISACWDFVATCCYSSIVQPSISRVYSALFRHVLIQFVFRSSLRSWKTMENLFVLGNRRKRFSSLQDGRSSGTSACLGSVHLHFEGNGTIISRQGRYGQRSPCTQNYRFTQIACTPVSNIPVLVSGTTMNFMNSRVMTSLFWVDHSKFHSKFCRWTLCHL